MTRDLKEILEEANDNSVQGRLDGESGSRLVLETPVAMILIGEAFQAGMEVVYQQTSENPDKDEY